MKKKKTIEDKLQVVMITFMAVAYVLLIIYLIKLWLFT